jgi:di/tripeptidase
MKITKARLVEIIKEEIAGLDEGTLGGLFSRGPKDSERPGRRPKGNQTPEEARGEVAARRKNIGSAVDALPKRHQMIANAAVADAAEMDSKLEQEIDALQQRDIEISNAVGELDNLGKDVEDRLIKYFATKTDLRNTLSKLTSQRMIDLIAAKVAEKMPAGATKSATMSPEQRAKLDALKDFEEDDRDIRN